MCVLSSTESACCVTLIVTSEPPLKSILPATGPAIAMFLVVSNVSAVVAISALPVRSAVIIPAAKSPLASLTTALSATFAESPFRETVRLEPTICVSM